VGNRRGLLTFANIWMEMVWRVVEFLLNGLAFILIGLQLRKVNFQLGDYPFIELCKDMGAIVVAVIVVRILWVFPAAYQPRLLIPSLRRRDPYPS
jgi:monovalent cation/hydrogen antiporter